MSGDHEFMYKLILTGDSGVGKTQLLSRYANDSFEEESKVTVGAEFASKLVNMGDHVVKTQIWDTAGHERYRAITTAFYRGAKGALLCFDLSDRNSFNSLDDWLSTLRENADPDVCIVLVGTKCDLPRRVEADDAIAFADTHHLVGYLETSAKDSINVSETFFNVVEAMFMLEQKGGPEEAKLDLEAPKPAKKGCAC
eukprot:GHVL01037935.1.p1 GENE.GHVL01037935.1~~GHVL01037935.1.p1  ORF type:complete len:197 (-),score=26.27 GHVL01037935.1:173-763(-)